VTIYEHLLPKSNYRLSNTEYGTQLIVFAPWNGSRKQEIKELVAAHAVTDLALRPEGGWPNEGYLMVKEYQALIALSVVDHFRVSDLSCVHALNGLRSLEVRTFCRTAIDFSAFPHLLNCFLEWRPNCESMFNVVGLRHLGFSEYPGIDLRAFKSLPSLTSLNILNSRLTTLEGIESLKSLTRLELVNLRSLRSLGNIGSNDGLRRLSIHGCPRLRDLTEISSLYRLEELSVDGCRGLRQFSEVSSLNKLEKLSIDDCGPIDFLPDLTPLSYLKDFSFAGSTNVGDGNLSVLTKMPNLTRILFQDRRHYTHKSRDFWQSGDQDATHAAMIALRARAKRLKRDRSQQRSIEDSDD
jgi:hypothetical protein